MNRTVLTKPRASAVKRASSRPIVAAAIGMTTFVVIKAAATLATTFVAIAAAVTCVTTIVASGIEVRAADDAKRRNLLVITADDMNADSAGWAGNGLGVTPNLDAFARGAVRFVNSHVSVPICQPGRSALMTGRVPHRNGALGFGPIRRDVPTLVEVLREGGYYTGVIAKAAHMAPADKFPWHAIGEQGLGKRPAKFAEKLVEMITAAKNEGRPFFINANICDPHRPFVGAAAKRGGKQAVSGEAMDGVRLFEPKEVAVPAFLEELAPVRQEVAQYYTSVSRFDVTFGMVMRELAKSGCDDNTVVVFMSDHGMSFPFSKATVYRNGTWSPVLIRVPGVDGAKTREEFVSSVDVMPSVLELLGVAPPAGMDGRSWVPLLRGESQADRDHVITHVNTVSGGKSFPQRCIRTKGHALMFHGWVGGSVPFRVEAMSGLSFAAMNAADDAKVRARVKQLVEGEALMFFDLAADPNERVNRIDDPKFASEIAELSTGLLEAMRRTEDPQTEAFAAAIARWGQARGR